jgi:hypothetical protein
MRYLQIQFFSSIYVYLDIPPGIDYGTGPVTCQQVGTVCYLGQKEMFQQHYPISFLLE